MRREGAFSPLLLRFYSALGHRFSSPDTSLFPPTSLSFSSVPIASHHLPQHHLTSSPTGQCVTLSVSLCVFLYLCTHCISVHTVHTVHIVSGLLQVRHVQVRRHVPRRHAKRVHAEVSRRRGERWVERDERRNGEVRDDERREMGEETHVCHVLQAYGARGVVLCGVRVLVVCAVLCGSNGIHAAYSCTKQLLSPSSPSSPPPSLPSIFLFPPSSSPPSSSSFSSSSSSSLGSDTVLLSLCMG